MTPFESSPESGPQSKSFEAELKEAGLQVWEECPDWVKEKVSPLLVLLTDQRMRREILAITPEDFDRMEDGIEVTEEDLEEYVEAAYMLIDANHERFPRQSQNAYHGGLDKKHERQVVERTAKLIMASTPKPTRLHAMALIRAAAEHDVDHPGGPAVIAEDGKLYEQRSAEIFVRGVRASGMTIRQGMEGASALFGTVFGQPDVQPQTQWEGLLKLADVGGYMEDWDEWIDQSLRISEEYAGVDKPPQFIHGWLYETEIDVAIQKWLEGQKGFIAGELVPLHDGYLDKYADGVDDIREALEEKRKNIDALVADIHNPQFADTVATIRTKIESLWSVYG